MILGFVDWIRGNKDRELGADDQKISDLERDNEIYKAMAEAAQNSPSTKEQLEDSLGKGEL